MDFLLRKLKFPWSAREVNSRSGGILGWLGVWKNFIFNLEPRVKRVLGEAMGVKVLGASSWTQ